MNPVDLITDHLDVWTTAQTQKATGRGKRTSNQSIYGIKKLRELILELAVRGKLVPQDPKDEPASTLLRRIAEEKTRLTKIGKIRKHGPLQQLNDDEKPFDLPEGWARVQLGSLLPDFQNGASSRGDKDGKEIVVIRLADINNGRVSLTNTRSLTINESSISKYSLVKDDVLVIRVNGSAAIVGRFVLCDQDLKAIYCDHFIRMRFPIQALFPAYLELLGSSSFIRYRIRDLFISTAGQKTVNQKHIRSLVITVPPLAEQHRIIAKVDELMTLCDQLEQQQTNSNATHQTLVKTLLATLTHPGTGTDGTETNTIETFFQYFDTLFTTEQSIDQLKQTILQLAVMGKLVSQDANDKPASTLLKKIAEERVKLVKAGKIKKPKDFVNFNGLDELKRTIPNYWEFARLADVADIVRGGSPRPAGNPRFYDGKIPFLKVADVSRAPGKMVEGFNATIKEAGLEKTRFINTRTVLLTNSGATLGLPAICDFPATFNDGIAAFVELSDHVYDEYLHLYLKSLSMWFINIASRGQGQPNLNTDIIKATWFALPPIAEQHRIVAKVDELMAQCDLLKSRLFDAQTTQLQLANAIVDKAIA